MCSRVRVVRAPRKSRFIRLFAKTPPGIHCPHFWLSAWANGCLHSCKYCWARGTFRGYRRTGGRPIVYTNVQDHLEEVREWLAKPGQLVLNFGELCDSLCLGVDHLIPVLELFGQQKRHWALLVSKAAVNVEKVISCRHGGRLIMSWSVNPEPVVSRFEPGTASLAARLAAAEKAREAGLIIRFRMDPMLPVAGWQELYRRLADRVAALKPERVTLGTLRFFPTVPQYFPEEDREVFRWGTDRRGVDGRYRLPRDLRLAMYLAVGRRLRRGGVKIIGLCKEEEIIWRELGRLAPGLFRRDGCNCLPPEG